MTDALKEFSAEFAKQIRRFNQLVDSKAPADSDAMRELSSILSRLLDVGERCPDAWSDTEIEAPELDHDAIQKMISKRFPEFGFYNSSNPSMGPMDDAKIEVNDASYDVYDIYCDLNDSLWYFDNDEYELGLWSAKLLFGHWGRHAINLKSYLHKQLYE